MHYGIKILSIGALLCFSTFGIIYWKFYNLPHPSNANANQLGYWLVLKDLSKQPEEIQVSLVDRLIEDSSLLESGGGHQLTKAQAEQLRKNMDVLKFAWFSEKVRQYVQSKPESKWEFLSDQIAVVADWAALTEKFEDALYPNATGEIDHAAMFFDEVELWLEKTPKEKHRQAYDAVSDAITCWLAVSSLEEQPVSTRLELANRITREFEAGASIGKTEEFIPVQCQPMFLANAELLLEAWLVERGREFAVLTDGKARARYADELIDKVKGWGVLSVATGLNEEAESAPKNPALQQAEAFAQLNEKVELWSARCEEMAGKGLRDLASCIKQRLFLSLFRKKK